MARSALALLRDDTMRKALGTIDATAMKTLLAAATQSSSLEEIEVVFRYQAARFRDRWDGAVIDKLLDLLRTAAKDEKGDEKRARLAAEQLGFVAKVHKVALESKPSNEPSRGR
jgi:hypothetical protein